MVSYLRLSPKKQPVHCIRHNKKLKVVKKKFLAVSNNRVLDTATPATRPAQPMVMKERTLKRKDLLIWKA